MSTLTEKVTETYRRIRERGDDGVWISLVPEEVSLSRVRGAEASDETLPLAGKLFAIKDNIDLEGLPTTAACPEFAFTPTRSATVVQRLVQAGAIPIGKTNLDQFATGLNGTRTPYPIPRNSVNPDYISGGSSSGSAIAVAAGLVDFALGTDTAGSGRVPAAFNNLIGLKPTVGRWSTFGLLPACRTLDCITVFSKTIAEAVAVDQIVRGFDLEDPFSRRPQPGHRGGKRIGILAAKQREFFGDSEYARLYAEAIERARELGWEVAEFDYEPFRLAANLLYSGPWVAERYVAIREFLETRADAVHPAVRTIVEGAKQFSALDAFQSRYRLAELKRQSEATWETFDAILLPTAGTIYTVNQLLADPLQLNTNLGRYTNFVNLLDLSGIAFPAGHRADGLPFGATLIGPAWTDEWLAELAAEFIGEAFQPECSGVQLAVVGAHLSGLPLNYQLRDLGARWVESTRTAASYRLYALPNTQPPKPGLVRGAGGSSIELEVWELTLEAFGYFVEAVPAPLAIGNVELESGKWVKGFVCEPRALEGATDITSFGGWRAYLAAN